MKIELNEDGRSVRFSPTSALSPELDAALDECLDQVLQRYDPTWQSRAIRVPEPQCRQLVGRYEL